MLRHSNMIAKNGVMKPMASRLVHKGNKVPKRVWFKAWVSWLTVLPMFALNVLLGWLLMGWIVAATARRTENAFGEIEIKHDADYIAQGSSGLWEYYASPLAFCDDWNVYEDGALGEPSGKHSARVKGKERSYWSKVRYIMRNIFNKGKRTNPRYACFVNDCTLEYWGDFSVTDKDDAKDGWHFVVATHTSGRKYYGYRRVKLLGDNKLNQTTLGYKIKPSHGVTLQDQDDLDKAFTFRKQLGAEIG